MNTRQQLAHYRAQLLDIANELDGLALDAGPAAFDVSQAAEGAQNAAGRITDALTHRLDGDR